jgi:hypothetical protein
MLAYSFGQKKEDSIRANAGHLTDSTIYQAALALAVRRGGRNYLVPC